jgi:hypothetical protein
VTSAAKSKIKPPPIRSAEGRVVDVPPTVGAKDTTQNDQLNPQSARASFQEGAFARAIRQHGKFVMWRKAMICPCQSLETEQPKLACVDCGGSGYIYVDPLPIRALMLAFDKKTSIFEKYGLWQEGMTQITVEPHHRMGYRDSFEMLDAVLPMNELLSKGDRRGRRSKLPDGVDSARFRITSAARAFFRDAAGVMRPLEPKTDFDITPEGWLKWRSRAVKDGAIISLHYDFNPIYLVMSWPHATRDDVSGTNTQSKGHRAEAQPVQGMGKLMFLVDANAAPSMDPVVRAPSGFGPGGPNG